MEITLIVEWKGSDSKTLSAKVDDLVCIVHDFDKIHLFEY
jgi:hypothetical protein